MKSHQEHSGKKQQYVDPQTQERYIPYVVETSVGVDRTVLMILSEAYREEEVRGESRTVLKFHPSMAPIKVALFPLVKKDGMPELAHAIEKDLSGDFNTFYDEKGAIGRRYRRMDEVGTPFCVTVDGETQEAGTVTIRERDSMEQVRIPKENVAAYILRQDAQLDSNRRLGRPVFYALESSPELLIQPGLNLISSLSKCIQSGQFR